MSRPVLLFVLGGALLVGGAELLVRGASRSVWLIRQSRRETPTVVEEYDEAFAVPVDRVRPVVNVAFVLVGLGLLVVGARWLVEAAVTTATALGVSELVIGLTIVAAGTSLPEVATSVLATIRGERDIAVGNVIGSCIFNLLAVLGLGGLVAPDGIPVSQGALSFDIPVMIAVAIATLPVLLTGHTIARWEAALFVGYYVAYTSYLVLDAAEHGLAPQLGAAIIGFVAPITVLTIAASLVRHRRHHVVVGVPGQAKKPNVGGREPQGLTNVVLGQLRVLRKDRLRRGACRRGAQQRAVDRPPCRLGRDLACSTTRVSRHVARDASPNLRAASTSLWERGQVDVDDWCR